MGGKEQRMWLADDLSRVLVDSEYTSPPDKPQPELIPTCHTKKTFDISAWILKDDCLLIELGYNL